MNKPPMFEYLIERKSSNRYNVHVSDLSLVENPFGATDLLLVGDVLEVVEVALDVV